MPYPDIVPVSVYPTYYGEPHAWVRWRVESASRAIENSGYTIGRDYLAGQKTLPRTEIYNQSKGITPRAATTTSGTGSSRAPAPCSSTRTPKDSSATLTGCRQRLSDAARQLTGPENPRGGNPLRTRLTGPSATVLSGPARTPSEAADEGTRDYPAVDVPAVTYDGEVFIIVVNSATEAVTVRIAGSPSRLGRRPVRGGRIVAAASGAWQDASSRSVSTSTVSPSSDSAYSTAGAQARRAGPRCANFFGVNIVFVGLHTYGGV